MADRRTLSLSSICFALNSNGDRAPGCILNNSYYINRPLVIDIHEDEGIVDLHDGLDTWRAVISTLLIEGEHVPENITAEELEELLLPYSTDEEGAGVSWSDVGGNIFGNTDLTKYFIFGNTAFKGYDEVDLKNLYKEIILLNREAVSYDPTFQPAQATIRAYGAHFTDLEGNSVALSAYGPHIPQEDYLPQIDIKAANGAHVIIKPSTLLLEDEVGNQLVITATSQFGSAQTVYDNTTDTNSIERRITSTGKVGFYVVEKLVMKGPYDTTDLIINPETDALYLVGINSPYETYAFIDGALVQLGTTQIELDDYYTKAQTENYVDGSYYNKVAIDSKFNQYYTSTQTNNYVTAALAAYEVPHDPITLTGAGTTTSPLKVADPLVLEGIKSVADVGGGYKTTFLNGPRITMFPSSSSGGQQGQPLLEIDGRSSHITLWNASSYTASAKIQNSTGNEPYSTFTAGGHVTRELRGGRYNASGPYAVTLNELNACCYKPGSNESGDFKMDPTKDTYYGYNWFSINHSKWRVNNLVAGDNISLTNTDGTWRIDATGGDGTMTVVEHDSTLEGDGTSTNELRVASPFNPNDYYTSSQLDQVIGTYLVKSLIAGAGIGISDQNNGAWEISVTNPFNPNNYYTASQLDQVIGTYHVKDLVAGDGIQITDQSNGSWQITQIPTLGQTFTLTKTVGTVAASTRPNVERSGSTNTVKVVTTSGGAIGTDGPLKVSTGSDFYANIPSYTATQINPNGTLRVASTDTTNGTVTFSATDGVVAGYRFVSVWATKSNANGDITCDILSGVDDDGLITSSASVQVQYRNESISAAASGVKIHLTLAQPVSAIDPSEYTVKSLVAGSNITLSNNSGAWTINSTGGGGGGGAVEHNITLSGEGTSDNPLTINSGYSCFVPNNVEVSLAYFMDKFHISNMVSDNVVAQKISCNIKRITFEDDFLDQWLLTQGMYSVYTVEMEMYFFTVTETNQVLQTAVTNRDTNYNWGDNINIIIGYDNSVEEHELIIYDTSAHTFSFGQAFSVTFGPFTVGWDGNGTLTFDSTDPFPDYTDEYMSMTSQSYVRFATNLAYNNRYTYTSFLDYALTYVKLEFFTDIISPLERSFTRTCTVYDTANNTGVYTSSSSYRTIYIPFETNSSSSSPNAFHPILYEFARGIVMQSGYVQQQYSDSDSYYESYILFIPSEGTSYYSTQRKLGNISALKYGQDVPACIDFSTDDFIMPYDTGNSDKKIKIKPHALLEERVKALEEEIKELKALIKAKE